MGREEGRRGGPPRVGLQCVYDVGDGRAGRDHARLDYGVADRATEQLDDCADIRLYGPPGLRGGHGPLWCELVNTEQSAPVPLPGAGATRSGVALPARGRARAPRPRPRGVASRGRPIFPPVDIDCNGVPYGRQSAAAERKYAQFCLQGPFASHHASSVDSRPDLPRLTESCAHRPRMSTVTHTRRGTTESEACPAHIAGRRHRP